MKATIDFDPELYRQLKTEAAIRQRTVRDLVDEGVRLVLGTPRVKAVRESSPAYLGALRDYAENAAGSHDLRTVRASIERARRDDAR